MRIERTMHYDAAPDTVARMSCDPAFQERKCADAGALSWKVSVVDDGSSTVVRTRRTLPTTGFPSMLRTLLPPGMVSTETIVWAANASADGSRTAELTVDFHGVPADLNGTVRVSAVDAGSRVEVTAQFRAHVPLIGSRVEKLAAPIILTVIDSEQVTGRAWLAAAH